MEIERLNVTLAHEVLRATEWEDKFERLSHEHKRALDEQRSLQKECENLRISMKAMQSSLEASERQVGSQGAVLAATQGRT